MKERDIRPEVVYDEFLRLNAEDIPRFFPGDGERRYRDCPGCGSDDHRETFQRNGFRLVRCQVCDSLFANPGPEAGRLAEFYLNSRSQKYLAEVVFPASAEARRKSIFAPRAARVVELAEQLGVRLDRMTDVGAGTGVFLDECRAAGADGHLAAVEPHGTLAAACREKGFETFEGFAEAAAADSAWAGKSDMVTASNVFEHVASPEAFVRDLAALARPGGLILFTGINGNGFDILALGAKCHSVCPPQHLNFLSRVGVRRLLERCGLEEAVFLTAGVLDVEVVRNALARDPEAVEDPFLRYLLGQGDEETLANFQRFLSEHRLSSHMWVVARRPA